MSKLFVRITILLVAIYMVICHIAMYFWQVNLWSHTYTVMFELCVCLCISAQGNYQCKYMRWTAYSICLYDTILSADEIFDCIPYSIAIILPFIIITAGVFTTTTLAIRHYFKVRRLKKIWKSKK